MRHLCQCGHCHYSGDNCPECSCKLFKRPKKMNDLTPKTASSPDGAAQPTFSASPTFAGEITCAGNLYLSIQAALVKASALIEAVWPRCPKDTPFAEIIARANQQREDAARTDLY